MDKAVKFLSNVVGLAAPSAKEKSFLDKCRMFAVIDSHDSLQEAMKGLK